MVRIKNINIYLPYLAAPQWNGQPAIHAERSHHHDVKKEKKQSTTINQGAAVWKTDGFDGFANEADPGIPHETPKSGRIFLLRSIFSSH